MVNCIHVASPNFKKLLVLNFYWVEQLSGFELLECICELLDKISSPSDPFSYWYIRCISNILHIYSNKKLNFIQKISIPGTISDPV